MGFAELRFHVLPGVDDGPSSLQTSIKLARAAAIEGTRTIVSTPHVNTGFPTDVRTLPRRVAEVAAELRRARVPVEILCGAELSPELVGRLSPQELELIAQGPPGSRWLLLEAPLSGLDDGFAAAAAELRTKGYAVVIAHPERSLGSLGAGWRVLEHELQRGCAIQLNAWSVAGLNGELVRSNALRLLHATPLVAIASDAHGPQRMPALRLALDALAGLGEPRPQRFVADVPRSMLERGLSVSATVLVA